MTRTERQELLCDILNRIDSGYCQVLGAGVSNVPLIRWLASKGAKITVRDMKSEERMDEKLVGELSSLRVSLVCGEGYLDSLKDLASPEKAVIFRSPGMRPDLPEIKSATDRGAILTSEMELFMLLTPTRVVAITGSDGKTTTTTLTGKILSSLVDGRVYVGGNIGKPLLADVEKMTEKDVAVVELSSFQLQTMKSSADIAAITNITPNHLNWHTGMEEYTEAKYNVALNGECRRLVINADNELSCNAGKRALDLEMPPKLVFFSLKAQSYREAIPKYAESILCEALFVRDDMIVWSDGRGERDILNTDEIKIPGRHNVANYMTAIGATLEYVTDTERLRELARTFGGVEHRLEFVREYKGVKYYNSSIDSTPTRTEAALSALSERPIVICGGADKGVSFEPLARALCERAKAVVLTGACRDKILDAITSFEGYDASRLPIYICPDFAEAVKKAKESAEKGDTVLLSPACTSFDAFKNFEERGNTFKNIVNSYK